jgi:hypothetical protein
MLALKLFAVVVAAASASSVDDSANPIRKVVTLMQDMQKEIEAEGVKEKELYDKFMCFCDGNNEEMKKSIEDMKVKIETYASSVESEKAEKVQLEQDLIKHEADKAAAIADLGKSTALRNKEKAEFDEDLADQQTNLAGVSSAIPALEKGMGGAAFVQLPVSKKIRQLIEMAKYTNSYDRGLVVSFLDQSGDYVPASGQIVGILKNMKDEMEASVKDLTTSEESAVKGYEELKAAKTQEEAAASAAIQAKKKRSGELALTIVQNSDGLEDTTAELAKTEKFLATLAVQCETKKKEWAANSKVMAEEVAAISQAIGILNDDDALDVFKKAVPSAALTQVSQFGFLQSNTNSRTGAMASAHKAQQLLSSAAQIYRSVNLQLLAFSSKTRVRMVQKHKSKADFSEIMKMIDGMVSVLTAEQADDEKHKAFCTSEFEKSAEEKTDTETEIAGLTSSIAELADEISTIGEDIATLKSGIQVLDKSVADATEQRKEEHAAYTESLALQETAIALIAKAKNRLQKFYNPTLYKAPPKVEISMEEKIMAAGGAFVQIEQPEAPETFGFYQKKTEKSGGVMALMDMITKEMESEMKDSEYDEKTAQTEYAELMADSQESRAQDTKSITEKESAKATLEAKLVSAKESKTLSVDKLTENGNYIFDLHASCDFIMESFGMRKEARTNEMESLKNAKAVLAGAVY